MRLERDVSFLKKSKALVVLMFAGEHSYVAVSRKATLTGGNRRSSHRIRLRAVYLSLFLSVRTNVKRH